MQNKQFLMILIIIIVIVAVIVILNSKSEPLPGYNTINDPEPTPSPTPEPIDSFVYEDENNGIKLSVPSDWSSASKDNTQTFVHAPTATSLQIKITKYNPQVTMTDPTTLSAQLTDENCNLINFNWDSGHSYTTLYQKTTNDGNLVDYVEKCSFDKDNVIRIIYIVNDKYFNTMENKMNLMFNSLEINHKNPIKDDFRLYYNEIGNFEFAIPINWTSGIVENAFFAQDQATQATMSVSVMENEQNFEGMTSVQYVELTSSGKNNYILKSFSSDKDIIYAVSSYNVNNMQIISIQYMRALNGYLYKIIFECPEQYFNELSPLFGDAIDLFRIF